jgi:hypothetical protein
VPNPFNDADLEIGYAGTLTWCRDSWAKAASYRVARGYFYVSRFHAAHASTASARLAWRPVLEKFDARRDTFLESVGEPERSPDQLVVYYGRVSNERLLGSGVRLDDVLLLKEGVVVQEAPDWLAFRFNNKDLFVAATPLRHFVSWEGIAQIGAALGDGSGVRLWGRVYKQRVTVRGAHGDEFLVRLLRCGTATHDGGSEWNRLIGAVHAGDGDFEARPDGIYGWVREPLQDDDIGVGLRSGAATWCAEKTVINGSEYATNRGYFTVSRFHRTPVGYSDHGFGWRPVLERVHDESDGLNATRWQSRPRILVGPDRSDILSVIRRE